MIGDIIRDLRTGASMTQVELGNQMGVIKQTISNWEKNISTPNIEAIVKIAKIFNVPTDYLLQSGVFENWDLLLANKGKVLDVISSRSMQISKDLRNGTDNITFAKLVYAFNISIQKREDGIGITIKDPIATYPNSLNFKHEPDKGDVDSEILLYYNQLSAIDKHWIMGQIVDLIKKYNSTGVSSKQSVAADHNERKVSGK